MNFSIAALRGCGTGKGKRVSQGGYTLLELMISIAMTLMIVLIVAGALRLGIRSVNASEKKINALERIRTSLNIMDAQIQSQFPFVFAEEGLKKYTFKGELRSLQFPTNYSIWGGQRGYVIVTYRVEGDDYGRKMLTASEKTVGMENARETKLVDNFSDIYFDYFYQEPAAEEGKWVSRWTEDASTPPKIRIHLVHGENDLSLIIPLRTGKSPIATVPGQTAPGPPTE